nr:FAD:protein FMN transferase [Sedimentibacter sp.]
MLKKIVAILIVITIAFNLSACDKKEQSRYEAQFLSLFDTVTSIVGYADSEEKFSEYSQLIYDNLKEYHELYDIYNDYEGINNIKTINDNAGIKPVKVDKRIIDLLSFAKDEYAETNGKTNVALGAVLNIWHDYRTEGIEDPENAKLPPMDELKAAAEHIDINNVIIDEENSTVFLSDPEMKLDVGAVAKGYATEQVSKLAKENGFVSGIISVGGNVRGIGNKANTGEQWNVGIQNPDKESENKVLKLVYLSDMSLVTSGNYERYYTVDGKRYNHIINQETLFPSEYFASVSIICENSGKADALSTAVFGMPFDQGKKLIDSIPNTEAMWIYNDGEIKYSENFEKLIKE